MPINRRIDEKTVVMHTMEYYSAIKKNRFELVLMSLMKVEPIIQSEVKPERKTPIQYTNMHMDFRKMVLITLYARQQKTQRCIEAFWTLWER